MISDPVTMHTTISLPMTCCWSRAGILNIRLQNKVTDINPEYNTKPYHNVNIYEFPLLNGPVDQCCCDMLLGWSCSHHHLQKINPEHSQRLSWDICFNTYHATNKKLEALIVDCASALTRLSTVKSII